ncbi:hypothetical protein B484DRAFT_119090 [Ochromonadaceae sp. CCMP2298]|nr:hypothetical protein B484DRAFT_119090 [Ochromonadaceae sp. CCMP2298]
MHPQGTCFDSVERCGCFCLCLCLCSCFCFWRHGLPIYAPSILHTPYSIPPTPYFLLPTSYSLARPSNLLYIMYTVYIMHHAVYSRERKSVQRIIRHRAYTVKSWHISILSAACFRVTIKHDISSRYVTNAPMYYAMLLCTIMVLIMHLCDYATVSL